MMMGQIATWRHKEDGEEDSDMIGPLYHGIEAFRGQTRPVITQTQTQQKSQYKKRKQQMRNTPAESSQNQGHNAEPISQSHRVQMWKPRF
ncbi:hypothetical protein YC2023_064271 [Brassica napus]